MTIGFDIGTDDLLAYNRNHFVKDPGISKRMRVWRIVFPLLFVALTLPGSARRGIGPGEIAMWSVAVLWALFFPWLMVRLAQRSARKMYGKPENARWLGYREMTFSDKGVETVQGEDRSLYAWDSLVKWDETGEYFFIYLSGMTGFIISKRALAPGQEDSLRGMFETGITLKTKK